MRTLSRRFAPNQENLHAHGNDRAPKDCDQPRAQRAEGSLLTDVPKRIPTKMSEANAPKEEHIWRWALGEAIAQMDLSWGARACLRILEAYPRDKCYPSHWYIAEKLKKSRSAVRRYLRELEQCGYIKITQQYDDQIARWPNRGQTSNSYTVLSQPDLTACANQIFQEWKAKQLGSVG